MSVNIAKEAASAVLVRAQINKIEQHVIPETCQNLSDIADAYLQEQRRLFALKPNCSHLEWKQLLFHVQGLGERWSGFYRLFVGRAAEQALATKEPELWAYLVQRDVLIEQMVSQAVIELSSFDEEATRHE